jgi:RND family efflux transporter MFP subunit
MKNLRQVFAWLAVLAIFGITSYFGWKALRDAEPEKGGNGGGGRPPSTVIVRPVESREVVESLDVTGTLRAVRRSEVAATESSALVELAVREGDAVERGGVIARQDARRLDALLAEARAAEATARAELAQREAERERAVADEAMMREAWEQRAVAERDYLDSVREMKVAEARENAARTVVTSREKQIDLLEVQRRDLVVHAPFDGRVVARHAEIGEWVAAGEPLVTLLSVGEIEAWLRLPERHAGLMRTVAPDQLELRVTGGREPLQVDRLTVVPEVSGRSRRFNLVAVVSRDAESLTPGVSVTATVPLGEPRERLVVSADAVLQAYDGNYVFVPDSSGDGPPKARRVSVDVRFVRSGESVLEPSGELRAGDQVIVEGNERLFPGAPLDPRPWSETRGEASEREPKS